MVTVLTLSDYAIPFNIGAENKVWIWIQKLRRENLTQDSCTINAKLDISKDADKAPRPKSK